MLEEYYIGIYSSVPISRLRVELREMLAIAKALAPAPALTLALALAPALALTLVPTKDAKDG